MGLDAFVYCNSFETGRLKNTPRPEWNVYVDEYSGRCCGNEELETRLAFDQWNITACQHEDGILLHHYLGNIALIAELRAELNRQPTRFPILLRKVVYSGLHAGDVLTIEDVTQLQQELAVLKNFPASNPQREQWLQAFCQHMTELSICAKQLRRPIVF